MLVARCLPVACLTTVFLASAAHAATLSLQVGDADCFGEAQSNCDNGAFPAIPVFNNTGPGDPAGTDLFDTLGTLDFQVALDLNGETATSALLEVRLAGVDLFVEDTVGDPVEGMGVFLNGALVGSFFEPVVIGSDVNQRAISTVTFSIPDLGLLNDGGLNTITLSPEQDFGLASFESYAVDYVALTIETEIPTAPVPLPASLPLLVGGIGAVWALSRRGRPGLRRTAG
ncbi:MAG: VPLPA-CTERM sorting domain-containing protein [Pseudomonadota bacterium]